MASASAPDTRTLTFDVGDERLGMAASLVQEVVPLPRLARVPHAPPALMGVAQIRGTIVPVLSVARLLGKEEAAVQRVIVANVDGPVGLAVTNVSQMTSDTGAAAVTRLDMASLIAAAVPERQVRRSLGTNTGAASSQDAEALSEKIALVGFVVSGQDFAFPLTVVDEILRLPSGIARMPHGNAATVGSAAWRGGVLPLLSLAALLGLPSGHTTSRSRVVIVRLGAYRLGLVVDAMGSIERVAETDVDAVPQVLNRGGAETRIQAICRLEGGARLLSVLVPDQLLNEDMTGRLQQGETEDGSDMTGEAGARGERFLLFRIGTESFGLPIEAVQEVALLPPRLTPLPRAPAFVQGLMSVRGQVIPVIDQAHRFNGGAVASAKPRVIVVRTGELTAGFVVDAVVQVVQPSGDAVREAPDLGTGMRLFDRVASLDDEGELVLIVSPQELLDRAERDLLLALGKKAAKSNS